MPSEKLQISVSRGARVGQTIIALDGPLTIHTVFDFQTTLRAQTAPGLILDFSNVPFVDSAGLGALVGAHLTTQRANRELAFVGFNTQVKALIDMTHVGQLFRAYSTVPDAEASLLSRVE
jgi:anti-sigma B factor antagonist